MPTTTPNLGLTLPTPNVDTGWGSTLNSDFVLIDNLFASDGAGTPIGVNIGVGKTLLLAGEMILGSGDDTGTVTPPTIRGAARTGTDATGADLTFKAANGTGTGGSGSFVFQTAPARSSGTVAGTLQNALIINNSSSSALVDVGAGGTASTHGQSSLRINGSSAGAGDDGGSVLLISNNSVTTGALGNRSAVYGGSTAYDSRTTLWGSQSISLVVRSAPLDASDEKVRIGDAGQIYLWDSTLGTPALNPGVANQVLKSSGPSGAAIWADTGVNRVASQTFAAAGNEYTGLSDSIKVITLSIRNIDPTSVTGDVLVRLQTSAGYLTTGYTAASSAINAAAVQTVNSSSGFVINVNGAVCSGIIELTNIGGNIWVCNHSMGATTTRTVVGGGSVDLPGELTGVQLIPSSGSFATSGTFSLIYQ